MTGRGRTGNALGDGKTFATADQFEKLFGKMEIEQFATDPIRGLSSEEVAQRQSRDGFTDAPYFNRDFKRLTGLTPGEYQKR